MVKNNKKKVGRPSKFKPEYTEKLRNYLENFDKPPHNDILPLVSSFANFIGVHRDTLHSWSESEIDEDLGEFPDLYKKFWQYQEPVLVRRGLTNEDKGLAMCIFMMKCRGWNETQYINNTHEISVDPDTLDDFNRDY